MVNELFTKVVLTWNRNLDYWNLLFGASGSSLFLFVKQEKDQRSLDINTAKCMLGLLLGKIWPLFPVFHQFLEVPNCYFMECIFACLELPSILYLTILCNFLFVILSAYRNYGDITAVNQQRPVLSAGVCVNLLCCIAPGTDASETATALSFAPLLSPF